MVASMADKSGDLCDGKPRSRNHPEEAHEVRADAIVAQAEVTTKSGRNNVFGLSLIVPGGRSIFMPPRINDEMEDRLRHALGRSCARGDCGRRSGAAPMARTSPLVAIKLCRPFNRD